MILHTVNRSPFQHDTLDACLRLAADGDAILLLEDGVLAGIEASPLTARLAELDGVQVYVLAADVAARGIGKLLADGITEVDYEGFVELTERHDRVVSWF